VTHAEIVHVDRYGNLISNLTATDLPPDPIVEIAGHTIVGLAPHFQAGEPGAPIALAGSAGLLEVAVSNGSAAALLGVGVGTPVTVTAPV
jgi:S-adenosylmethionine hydrolase